MRDSINNLKKAVISVRDNTKDKAYANELIETTIESFLWANGIVCSVKLDYIDDNFPN